LGFPHLLLNTNRSLLVSSKRLEKSRAQIRQLEAYLGVAEKPEDDLIELQEARMKGSCEWFAMKDSFQNWLDPESKQPHIYWISANPATGKSVLSGYIIEHLESLNFECSYYFFRHGDKIKSSLGGFLRSIAYQMALTSVDIRQRLVSMMDRDIRFDKDDERVIWRKIFGLAIFRATFQNPHYWVIDALDECANPAGFFQMITKLEATIPIKILFTSRRTPEIVTQFADFKKVLPSEVVEEEIASDDTFGDITLYLQSNMEKLPVNNNAARQDLLQKILDKSSGCFLWVKLVLVELEGAWGQHQIEMVLEEVPVDMDPLYTRALSNMARKPPRTKVLAKAILTWTMCATRPLTVFELQSALKFDIGDTIEALQKAVGSLCGQLVYVDKHSRIQMVHQTARTFLLRSDLDSEFAINSITGHLRLARVCLQYLNSEEMKMPRARKTSRVSISQTKRSALVNYASMSFAEHMRQTSSNNDELLGLLDILLRTNVLSWIEYVAQTGNLQNLTTTAKIISDYLLRQAKYTSPLSPKVRLASLWATDFIRLVANFGKKLLECPASIYWLVPPFCPVESAIATQFASTPRGIKVVGLSETTWDDRLACIQYPTTQATAVASGESYFAIGLQSGEVVLCHNATCQEWQRLKHGDPLKLLVFDTSGTTLATASRRQIKVWSVNSRSVMWSFDIEYDVLSMVFSEEDSVLIAATRGNGTLSWVMATGQVRQETPWTEAFGDERFRRPPLTAAFSPDLTMLAIVYRGRPISLWDIEDQVVLGFLGRNIDLENLAIGTNTSVASLVFNANPNIGLLAAAYEDGDLALFNYWDQTALRVMEANAQMVACSPDGYTLVTGNSAGMVQLFEFETLDLLYRINAFDYGVRCLAFSSDGLRFLDVRGQHCNIWEPSLLVRKLQRDREDVISESVPTEPKIVGVADIDDVVEITTLVCDATSDFIFAGKSDGSVCVYETRTGNQMSTLYNHGDDISITSLCWGDKSNIIVTADSSSQLIAKQLTYSKPAGWAASKPLLFKRLSVAINQLIMNADNNLLLVSADSSRSIWNLSSGKQTSTWSPLSDVPDYWIAHPTNPLKCLSFRTVNIAVVDWSVTEDAILDATIPLTLKTLPDERIKSVLASGKGYKLVVEISKKEREDSTTKVFIFDTAALQSASVEGIDSEDQSFTPLSDFYSLSPHVEHIIGTYNSKLVFLDRDLWVCSVDLERRTTFGRRDSDLLSVDEHSRRTSISQRLGSVDLGSSPLSRGRESAMHDATLSRHLSPSPMSRASTVTGGESSRSGSMSIEHPSSPLLFSPASPSHLTFYSRHFFVPTSWHSSLSSSSGRNLTIRVSCRGDVVFIKDQECAIIQRGLDFEELVPLHEFDPFST
jgi:hypothetical protein